MPNTIARLDAALRAQRPDYHRGLGAGASEDDLAALGTLPEALRALLSWRGGGRGRLVLNWSTMDAESIVEAKRSLDEMLDDGEFDAPSHWHRGWVPFLANGGGDHVCVDLVGCFGGAPGQVIEFWHDESWRTVVAPSLDAWLEMLAGAYEGGAVTEDRGSGIAELDEPKLAALRKKHAAGYPKEHDASEDPGTSSPARKAAPPKTAKRVAKAPKKVVKKAAKKVAKVAKVAKKPAKKAAKKVAKVARVAKKAAKKVAKKVAKVGRKTRTR